MTVIYTSANVSHHGLVKKLRLDSVSLKTVPVLQSIMSAVAKIWKDNKVLVVMGGVLTLGHFVWRELQNNTAFVPAGCFALTLKTILSVESTQDRRKIIHGLRLPSM